jgi:hypothetical protein
VPVLHEVLLGHLAGSLRIDSVEEDDIHRFGQTARLHGDGLELRHVQLIVLGVLEHLADDALRWIKGITACSESRLASSGLPCGK